MTLLGLRPSAVLALSLLGIASEAGAGEYWFHNVRSKTITLCFVGDAVTSRPDRVDEVRHYLREFEHSINVRFDYLGSCPASVAQANGNDFFDGDIRVVLPNTTGTKVSTWAGGEGTGPVPGKGCKMFLDGSGQYCDAKCNKDSNNDGWGSWSNAPDDLLPNRPCLYNLKLGDDPWNGTPYLNHTLHEFGHALGMSHEHERDDVDKTLCSEKGYGGGAANGHVTPYDRFSVMHYMFATCGINGNYDYTGLSYFDRLTLRILYPEDNRWAEYVGATLRRAGQPVALQSGWKARGANLGFAAKDFTWSINKTVVKNPDLVLSLPVGSYNFLYAYSDFLGRSYSSSGVIRVLSTSDYDRLMGASGAAQLPLF